MTDNIHINFKSNNFVTYTDKVLSTCVMYEIVRNELKLYTKVDMFMSYSGIEEMHNLAEVKRKELLDGRSYI
jgi:hypothetical protein